MIDLQRFSAVAAFIAVAASGSTASAATNIEFWTALSGQLGEQVTATCERFNASQTDYHLDCVYKGSYDDLLNQAIAAYRAGKQPAIIQGVDGATATLLLSDAVIPAYQLMAEQGVDINWDDYIPAVRAYYADTKNQMWSFPFNASTAVWYYNTDAFTKAGITKVPQTWSEFDAALKSLQTAGFDCPMAYEFDPWFSLEMFSAVNDIPVATQGDGYEGLDATYVFNTTPFVQHLEMEKGWLDAKLAQLTPPDAAVGARDLFMTGKCQVYYGSSSLFSTLKREAKVSWGIAPFPWNDGVKPLNTFVGGASLWTMKGFTPEQYKGVAEFYKFIATPKEQEAFSLGTGYMPVTISAYEAMKAAGDYEKPENKGREVAVEELLRATPSANSRGIRLGNYIQFLDILVAEAERAFNNEQTIQQALDAAASRGNDILRRYEAANKGKSFP